MKRKLTILSFMFIAHFTATAQIQIVQEDAPQAGHEYTSKVITAGYTDFKLTTKGPDVTWDYSGIVPTGTSTISFSTPDAAGLKDFPDANLVEFNGNQYQYFKIDASSTTLFGLKDTIAKKLNPPLVYSNFPVKYGDIFGGTSKVVIQQAYQGNISGVSKSDVDSLRVTVNIVKNDTVDSWGKITTPDTAYNALRIVTHASTTNKIEAKVSPNANPIILITLGGSGWHDVTALAPSQYVTPTYTRQFNWWAKGMGTQVFQIFLDKQAGTDLLSLSWFSKGSITAVKNSLPGNLISLAPNPNNGNVTFAIDAAGLGDYQLGVTDLSGRPCYSAILNSGMQTINFSNLPNGIYLVKLTDIEGRSVVKKMEINK